MKITRRSNEYGGHILELALVIVFFLGILGAFFYYYMFFHRYAALSDSVTTAVRRVAVRVDDSDGTPSYPNPGNKAALLTDDGASSIQKRIRDHVEAHYSKDTATLTFPLAAVCQDENGRCRLRVNAQWGVPCFFCFFTGPLNVKVNVDVGFDDPCFAQAVNGCLGAPTC